MGNAKSIGRTAPNGDEVWIIGTPHFEESWKSKRFGKSRTVSLRNADEGGADWAWVIDADDYIEGEFEYPKETWQFL